jgi:hypothetical protein
MQRSHCALGGSLRCSTWHGRGQKVYFDECTSAFSVYGTDQANSYSSVENRKLTTQWNQLQPNKLLWIVLCQKFLCLSAIANLSIQGCSQ